MRLQGWTDWGGNIIALNATHLSIKEEKVALASPSRNADLRFMMLKNVYL